MCRHPFVKGLRLVLLGCWSLVLILFLGAVLPSQWQTAPQHNCRYMIYVSTVQNFHTELIVPVTNEAFDWRSHLNLDQLGPNAADYQYLSFGWGDRAFFMDNTHDLKTILAALFLPTPTVMHVGGHPTLQAFRSPSFNLKAVSLNRANYLALTHFIQTGFETAQPSSKSREPQYLKRGLYPESGFYAATGQYSLLRTCNTWTAEALRSAHLNTPLWPALAPPILYHLPTVCT